MSRRHGGYCVRVWGMPASTPSTPVMAGWKFETRLHRRSTWMGQRQWRVMAARALERLEAQVQHRECECVGWNSRRRWCSHTHSRSSRQDTEAELFACIRRGWNTVPRAASLSSSAGLCEDLLASSEEYEKEEGGGRTDGRGGPTCHCAACYEDASFYRIGLRWQDAGSAACSGRDAKRMAATQNEILAQFEAKLFTLEKTQMG
ncbi:hypothetical protein C8J57DRAFT_1470497 [Mycena rebaudengoi]|nr:hypothetical protein C8J57DRAFT_1470497 [Mycena rebaudengoi]